MKDDRTLKKFVVALEEIDNKERIEDDDILKLTALLNEHAHDPNSA